MKKQHLFLLFLLLAPLTSSLLAQKMEKSDSAYGERCRNFRQSLIETGREFKAQTKNRDCSDLESYIRENIEGFKNAETDEDKNQLMISIAKISCPQVIDFYETVVLTDTSEFIRKNALMYLGWVDAQRSIPFLLNYYQNTPNLSVSERVSIGSTLIVLEVWDKGEQIVNQYCYDTLESIVRECVFCYRVLGNASSIKYFRHMNKKSGGGMNYVWDLVNVGDKETALPAIRFSIKKEDVNKKYELELLEMIGDEESIHLIESAQQDAHEEVRKDAMEVLKRINEKNSNKK